MAKKRYRGPYVSRGGEKLRGALDAFSFDPTGLSALDVGASTGGFTDCLLQAGAKHVTSLDVAYGQFAWSLRNDPRVTVIERTNFKIIEFTNNRSDVDEGGSIKANSFDLVVADLSFISLAKLGTQFKAALKPTGDLIVLVKPQFEASREEVPAGGVIVDPKLHASILVRLAQCFSDAGLVPVAWTYSPIKGPKGNIEFWLHARPCATIAATKNDDSGIVRVVQQAHADLMQD